MELNIIAAVAANRAIGYRNDMVYFIHEDLKRFKQLTTGHTVIMGRKTFHSLPKGALPNRRNIVLSRTEKDFKGCEVYPSLDEAMRHIHADEQAFIIGGASLYKEALPTVYILLKSQIPQHRLMSSFHLITMVLGVLNPVRNIPLRMIPHPIHL